jgi:Na+(H+)/acetate symporter ActP
LFAGALFITQATRLEGDYAIYIAILILLAIACIFTIAGGLSAVIWTDFLQTILMIVGAFILSGFSKIKAFLTTAYHINFKASGLSKKIVINMHLPRSTPSNFNCILCNPDSISHRGNLRIE